MANQASTAAATAAPAIPGKKKTAEEKKQFIVRAGNFPSFDRGEGPGKITLNFVPGEVVELTKPEYLLIMHMVDKYSPETEATISTAISAAEAGVVQEPIDSDWDAA